MPNAPAGVTTVSAHLGPDDRHILDVLRRRAAEGDRSLSKEVARTLRGAISKDPQAGTHQPIPEEKTG